MLLTRRKKWLVLNSSVFYSCYTS